MAAYNHEDQDSIDGIKTWWDKFGTAITVVLTALLVWRHTSLEILSTATGTAAADLYVLLQVQSSNDPARINDAKLIYLLKDFHPVAMLRAQRSLPEADVQAGNNKRPYRICNGSSIMQRDRHDLARLRITYILLDEEKYDEALRLIVHRMTQLLRDYI